MSNSFFFDLLNKRTEAKYRNKKTKCKANVLHASKIEAWRCDELHMLARTGVILGLAAHPQPRFPLTVNGKRITTYHADFAYFRADDPEQKMIVEDVKGISTTAFKLKAKLFEAIHGFPITMVKAR